MVICKVLKMNGFNSVKKKSGVGGENSIWKMEVIKNGIGRRDSRSNKPLH